MEKILSDRVETRIVEKIGYEGEGSSWAEGYR